MPVTSIDPAWKKLYELINDVARQKDAASMLNTIFREIDLLVPADHGVVLAEVIDGIPFSRSYPPYTASLAPLFNIHYNRTVPVEYDALRHLLGPVDWRCFPDSEYDFDFNRPLGIGHTLGIGIADRLKGCEVVLSMHRSRRSSGFTEREAATAYALREPLEHIYDIRREADQLLCSTLFEREKSRGCMRLSRRESQIAALLCRRITMREIAALLGISPRTVERHALHIYEKLNVSGRRELSRVISVPPES